MYLGISAIFRGKMCDNNSTEARTEEMEGYCCRQGIKCYNIT